jgi:hypothetical protein
MLPEAEKLRLEEQKANLRRPLHKRKVIIIAEVLFRMGQRSKIVLPEA